MHIPQNEAAFSYFISENIKSSIRLFPFPIRNTQQKRSIGIGMIQLDAATNINISGRWMTAWVGSNS